jgi:hypothetical protein
MSLEAARLYSDWAALKMKLALVRLMLKYSPDQPRVPAGNSDGGQWTGAGGEFVRVASNDRGEGRIATDARTVIPKLDQAGAAVVLPNGMPVANPYSKVGRLISPTQDLSPVAAAGREDGATYREMLASSDPDRQQAALPQLIGSINGAVGHGGTFDYQRSREGFFSPFVQLPQFRDVSNFNVGIYMQQTGIFSEDRTLSIAGMFARQFSGNYMPEQPYGLDPRTAFFIRAGYREAASGTFNAHSK